MCLVELVLHCVQALAQGISVGTLAVPAPLGHVSPLALAISAGIGCAAVGVRCVCPGPLARPALLRAICSGFSTIGTIPIGTRGLFRQIHPVVRLLKLLTQCVHCRLQCTDGANVVVG